MGALGFRHLLLAVLLLLGACGGGEQSESYDAAEQQDDHLPINITIGAPTTTGFYATTAESVRIAGTASHWDADIVWRSDAGGSGKTWPHFEWCLGCRYDWAIELPLHYGINVICIVASDKSSADEHTIKIRRDESIAQWSWAS